MSHIQHYERHSTINRSNIKCDVCKRAGRILKSMGEGVVCTPCEIAMVESLTKKEFVDTFAKIPSG